MAASPKTIIKKGFLILKTQKQYNQLKVVNKLKALKFKSSTASLNNILNDKRAGESTLDTHSEGIQKFIKQECCLRWEESKNDFVPIPSCIPSEIEEETEQEKNGITFHEGRLHISDKVRFFSTAKNEMIEFGLTLNTFTSYFFRRRPDEFKLPIHNLLERGVNIKCYLLDPDSNEARMYFEDRKNYYLEEGEGIDKIRRTLTRFKNILEEIDSYGFEGKMEVHIYKHVPHQYSMVIDQNDPHNGKLHISQYLSGELRSHCPVIECARKDNPTLFMLYCSSLQKLMSGAKRVLDFGPYFK